MADARVLNRLLLVFILAGLVLSVWAGLETAYSGLQGSCSVNSYVSCAKIDQSGLTSTGPFPDWSFGVGGFLLLLALYIPFSRTYKPLYLQLIIVFSLVGVALSVYFAYVEIVLIQGICPVCTGTYLSGVGVLGTALALRNVRASADIEEPKPSAKA